jgi:putative transposase
VLLRREGWKANHKRVYRLYTQAGLNLRRKRPRRRKSAAHRLDRTTLSAPNQCWSMDFVMDALFDGCHADRRGQLHQGEPRVRRRPTTEGEDVVAAVEALKQQHGLPQRIQTNNDSEFI